MSGYDGTVVDEVIRKLGSLPCSVCQECNSTTIPRPRIMCSYLILQYFSASKRRLALCNACSNADNTDNADVRRAGDPANRCMRAQYWYMYINNIIRAQILIAKLAAE